MRLLEADAGEIAGKDIREDDEESMAARAETGEHLKENLDELGIDGGEMSLALVEGER